MNQHIINLLIELKNASLSRKESVISVHNIILENLVKVLYNEGFVQSFEIIREKKDNTTEMKKISIVIRYFFNKPLLRNLKVLSKPSDVKYVKFSDICKISDKKVVFFFSTDAGILTTLGCKNKKIGGKLLFSC